MYDDNVVFLQASLVQSNLLLSQLLNNLTNNKVSIYTLSIGKKASGVNGNVQYDTKQPIEPPLIFRL